MLRFAMLAAAVLLAHPALGQTDDRISNDAMQLLAADTVVTEIGQLCIADTGNDPAMVAAIEGWRTRNQNWRIVAVTTLGTRGVPYTADSLALAQQSLRDTLMPNYVAADDKPAWCLRMAGDIETGQMSAGLMFPDAAKRIEEAKAGMWPVLDVENSYEVSNAVEALEWFDHNEQFMARCGAVFGDPQGMFEDAFPYWRGRNIEYFVAASKIMRNWGALDPEWIVTLREKNRLDIDSTFLIDHVAKSRCDAFVATVEDGTEDIPAIDEFLAEFLLEHADIVP